MHDKVLYKVIFNLYIFKYQWKYISYNFYTLYIRIVLGRPSEKTIFLIEKLKPIINLNFESTAYSLCKAQSLLK